VGSEAPEPVRLVEVLTNASSIAHLFGAPEVTLQHVREAVALLTGETDIERLKEGRPIPFRHGGSPQLGAAAPVRELAKAWFARVGGDVHAVLHGPELAAFRADVEERIAAADAGPGR
jgi:hypothetical protein